MPFELTHTFVTRNIKPKLHKSGEQAFFEVDERGEFSVLFPGRVVRGARATFTHRFRVDTPEVVEPVGEGPRPGTAPRHGGFEAKDKTIPLSLAIFMPDGREFTAAEITIADLRRFRDARGAPSGPWSFRLTGKSETLFVDEDSRLTNAKCTMRFGAIETILSESAPPLIGTVALTPSPRTFEFDLFRVGTFVAEVSKSPVFGRWRGMMRLIDPDRAVRAQASSSKLLFNVDLPTLAKSRDAAGAVRKWKLEVFPNAGIGGVASISHLSATVIGSGRFTIAALKNRIDTLLGPSGSFIQIFGEDKNEQALLRLRITDHATAETIDMHGLLENVLSKTEQDGEARFDDIQANTIYTLGRKPDDVSQKINLGVKTVTIPLKLKVASLKVDAIDVAIGPGVKLGASVPVIRLTISVSGKARIKFGALTLADVEVPGGKIEIEIGITLSPDGTPQIVTFVPDKLFDGDIDTTTAAAIIAATPGLGSLSAAVIHDSVGDTVKEDFNDPLVKGIREAFADPTLAPSILMMIFGAHLSYRSFRFEGDDILFEHIAPLEPDPKPRPGYLGAVGRSFTQLGPNAVRFTPPRLDTWKAGNLAKIDHVVVVMMENRSYDHVLGYRAALGDGADGLTQDMINTIEKVAPGSFKVPRLREAGFAKNDLGGMTRLPRTVGHEFHDVQQQLSRRVTDANGRTINSPKGFVDNFAPRLALKPKEVEHGVVANDVLGFYDNEDLPFFKFLAENYAYCDRYFSSHPGPTLPNRMYALTGDLQYDRYGFPIIDNNNGDNFLLSRMPTIFDLLERKGLSFRVYESFPSVAMLRMFARYATDTTKIVPIARLEADLANKDFPAFTVIEPALHTHPQDDDHPDADMHRGQFFLRGVYDMLRSSRFWEKTLFIITYDEHGGFYDHVVPPVADLIQTGNGPVANPNAARPPASLLLPAAQPGLLPIPYGVRVPAFVVSPWTMRGKGPSITLDHCSILKTVLARFLGAEKPFLSDRVSASHSLDAFLTEAVPRLEQDVPEPPEIAELPIGVRSGLITRGAIITKPLSRKEMREGSVDFHEISGRWARQLGR